MLHCLYFENIYTSFGLVDNLWLDFCNEILWVWAIGKSPIPLRIICNNSLISGFSYSTTIMPEYLFVQTLAKNIPILSHT